MIAFHNLAGLQVYLQPGVVAAVFELPVPRGAWVVSTWTGASFVVSEAVARSVIGVVQEASGSDQDDLEVG